MSTRKKTLTMKNTEVTLIHYTLKTCHSLMANATYLFLLLKQWQTVTKGLQHVACSVWNELKPLQNKKI